MSISAAVSVVQCAPRSSRHTGTRAALTVMDTLGVLLSSTRTSAQTSAAPATGWEFRVTSGALLPTGNQRNFLKDAPVTTAQLSWVPRPSLAVTGTFGWARSRDRASADNLKLDVFTSDLGVEARSAQWFADRAVTFSPFVGFGAGARSYNYRTLNVDATHNLAGYGTVGGELGMGRVGLRLEVRDYASGFRPLVGPGKSDTRNDGECAVFRGAAAGCAPHSRGDGVQHARRIPVFPGVSPLAAPLAPRRRADPGPVRVAGRAVGSVDGPLLSVAPRRRPGSLYRAPGVRLGDGGSIILPLDAIRRRDFASHGSWMIRAYAIGMGAGTQVLTHMPWFLLVGAKPGELPRALLMGAGWVINVVMAESIIRKRQARSSTVLATVGHIDVPAYGGARTAGPNLLRSTIHVG